MNPCELYELLGREKKALNLAAAIREACPDVNPDTLAILKPSAPFWRMAAVAAKVPPPSAKTCSAVIALLKGKP